MTEQNFKCWGRLIAFGAVLLTGCSVEASYRSESVAGERIKNQPGFRAWDGIVRTPPDSNGVVCYSDTGTSYGRKFSCVKVKP